MSQRSVPPSQNPDLLNDLCMTIPPALKKSDLIAMVGPSGYIDIKRTTDCVQMLKNWSYKVTVYSDTVGFDTANYFAGSDVQRTRSLQAALYNKEVKAIIFARG